MKIIVLVGVPASGKSTWAREYYKEHKDNTVIVNRDSIRFGRGDYWVPSQEDYIDRVEYSSVENALKLKYDVIIDATNLDLDTQDKWRDLALKRGADIEFKEFYVPFSVAVERDENPGRQHHVGKKVIKKFYQKYYNEQLEEEMKPTKIRKKNCLKTLSRRYIVLQ